MIMYAWRNKFHNTTARSTLNEQELEDISYKVSEGYLTKTSNENKKLQRLYKSLCPHNNHCCSCVTMMYISGD